MKIPARSARVDQLKTGSLHVGGARSRTFFFSHDPGPRTTLIGSNESSRSLSQRRSTGLLRCAVTWSAQPSRFGHAHPPMQDG